MNDPEATMRIDTRPEVADFVAAVRTAFADLGPEERDDLLGGLEADIAELVADQGAAALGDPAAYARELRAAAGLPESSGPVRAARAAPRAREVVTRWLDHAHDLGLRALGLLPWGLDDVVRVLRPAWWLVRAWAVVAILNVWFRMSSGAEFLPTGDPVLGVALLVAAGVLSVLVGLGRLWPGRGGVVARLLVLAVNIVALLAGPGLALDAYNRTLWNSPPDYASTSATDDGVWMDGRRVCNLQPFDADGNQLVGVQLFDHAGRALDVRCEDPWGPRPNTTAYPWLLGDVERWNVFPQAEREQRGPTRKRLDPGRTTPRSRRRSPCRTARRFRE